VEELGYDGYQRLRRAFDRSFGGEAKVPLFNIAVDAGCGTGLVGEQVRDYHYYISLFKKCILIKLNFVLFCSFGMLQSI